MEDTKKAPLPETSAERAPRQPEYVGPQPAPVIRFDGLATAYHADDLPPELVARYIREVPANKGWWK